MWLRSGRVGDAVPACNLIPGGCPLYEFLLAAIVLGVWHAILVRMGRVPGWARTVVRVLLALVIVSELTRFLAMESLPWRTQGLDPGTQMHKVQETMGWVLWLDIGSPLLLGIAVVVLLVLSVLRAIRGPVEHPVPAEPPAEA